MNYILMAILFYLLFRFIVGFVLPVARTTSQVKKQFSSMKEKMEEHQAQQNGTGSKNPYANNSFPTQKPKYDMEGEYISFEETKD